MTHIILYSISLILIRDLFRPRSFLETGFRPLCPSFVWFVPLTRAKPAFWIRSAKPISSDPVWILLDGVDTRLIRRSFSCSSSCEIYESHMWLILMSHMWHILMWHMSMSSTHISHMTHMMCDVTPTHMRHRTHTRHSSLSRTNWNRCGDQLCQGRWYPDSARYWAGVYNYILTHIHILSHTHAHTYTNIYIYIYIYNSARWLCTHTHIYEQVCMNIYSHTYI